LVETELLTKPISVPKRLKIVFFSTLQGKEKAKFPISDSAYENQGVSIY
jgi:hypothetical protein